MSLRCAENALNVQRTRNFRCEIRVLRYANGHSENIIIPRVAKADSSVTEADTLLYSDIYNESIFASSAVPHPPPVQLTIGLSNCRYT